MPGRTTKTATKPAKGTTAGRTASKGFTAEERAAMRARAQELKAEARANKNREDGERDVLAAIAAMQPKDRVIARRIHEIVTAAAPDLAPKTWYGMPAYADKDGKVVVFFRDAGKFKERYSMLGFNETANLDSGSMWPVAYALPKLAKADEAKIRKLVKQAVS